MQNTSDIEHLEKRSKNPTMIQSIFNSGNVEKVALESFMAKKKLQKQRQELKTFINFYHGPNSWNEILQMEADIRLQRKKEIYDRQQFVRKIWEVIGWIFLACTVIGFLFALAYVYKESR